MPAVEISKADIDAVADGLLTIAETAEWLRICRVSVYAAINRGELLYVKLPGHNARRIPRSEVLAYAARGLVRSEIARSAQHVGSGP